MREVFGTSTGIMDCSHGLGEELEEEGELRIMPVWNVMES